MKTIIIKSLILFIISLTIVSCSKDDLTNPISIELIGNWNNENYSITFFNNGTFIDTIYFENIRDKSYRSYGRFTRSGTYKIENEILYLNDFYFTDIITNADIGMQMMYISYNINIANNKLILKPVNVFESDSSNTTELYGSWKLNGYYCVYDKALEQNPSNGSMIETYKFYKDSSKYIYSLKYLSGIFALNPQYTVQDSFAYEKPLLDLPLKADYKINVKLNGNKMFWYYDYEINLNKN